VAEVRPIGPTGGGGDKHYTHVQVSAQLVWNVAHNLGKRPTVAVVDSAGTQVVGEVDYVDDNHLTVTFTAPFGGRAYCN